MFTILEKLGLPIPSKLTIILCVALLLSILLNLSQCKKINDKEEIIKGKEVAISVQNATISKLQKETNKSIQKIEEMNKRLSLSESEYQKEVNKLLMSIEDCSPSAPLSEIEKREQETLSIILNKLAKSTRFKEEKK